METLSKIFNKLNIVLLIPLLVLIILAEVILTPMHLAIWPAFMIMIFFFMAHMNIKEAPAILVGSAFGLFNLVLIGYWFIATVPLFGGDMAKYTSPQTQVAMFNSTLIYIVIFVALIVFLKDVIPWVFNNYAFMCFTVAAAVAGANTAAEVAAKTVAGYADAVVGAAGNPTLTAAMKSATDKAVAATVPVTNVYQWIGVELIVGLCFIAGIYGIAKLLAKVAQAPAHKDIKG